MVGWLADELAEKTVDRSDDTSAVGKAEMLVVELVDLSVER